MRLATLVISAISVLTCCPSQEALSQRSPDTRRASVPVEATESLEQLANAVSHLAIDGDGGSDGFAPAPAAASGSAAAGPAPVPEPGTLLLVGTGLVGVALMTRGRRRRSEA